MIEIRIDGNVIHPDFAAPRRQTGRLILDPEGDGPTCQHRYVAIRKNDRTVVCRTCRRYVSPFEVLLALHRDWSWATHWAEEQERYKAEVESLKREVRNLKARVRRA